MSSWLIDLINFFFKKHLIQFKSKLYYKWSSLFDKPTFESQDKQI